MYLKFILAMASAFSASLVLASAVHAETLAVQHAIRHRHHAVHAGYADVPARGLTMAQVQLRYGAPLDKLPPAGGDAPRHPTINRWRYGGYTVYFERSRVIHSVRNSVAAAPRS